MGRSIQSFVPVKSMNGWWPRLDDLNVWDVETDQFSIDFPLLGLGPDPDDSRLVEKIVRLEYENGRFSSISTSSRKGVTLSREPLPDSATTNSCILDK